MTFLSFFPLLLVSCIHIKQLKVHHMLIRHVTNCCLEWHYDVSHNVMWQRIWLNFNEGRIFLTTLYAPN